MPGSACAQCDRSVDLIDDGEIQSQLSDASIDGFETVGLRGWRDQG